MYCAVTQQKAESWLQPAETSHNTVQQTNRPHSDTEKGKNVFFAGFCGQG